MLTFPRPPLAVVLRDESDTQLEHTPKDGAVTLDPTAFPGHAGTWSVYRRDPEGETPVRASLIDPQAFPIDPSTATGLRLAIPTRNRARHHLQIAVRHHERYAEVRGVETGNSGIAIRGTVLGATASDPQARLVLTLRSDRSVEREIRCPVAETGEFAATVPPDILTDGHDNGEGDTVWDLKVRSGAGTAPDTAIGRCLDGVTGYKKIISYPEWVFLTPGQRAVKASAYYTVNGMLAVSVADSANESIPSLLARAVHNITMRWSDRNPPELVVAGEINETNIPDIALDLHLASGEAESGYTVPARTIPTSSGRAFTARLPMETCAGGSPLPPGSWNVSMSLHALGSTAEIQPEPEGGPTWRRWWRGLTPLRATAAIDGERGMRLAVTQLRLWPVVLRRVRSVLAPVSRPVAR